MFLSVFDIFKIGVGPSSSHTMGPMVAASEFLTFLRDGDWPRPASSSIDRIRCSLHGSLAFTGKGHASDRAVILGLMGCTPETLEPDRADEIVELAIERKSIAAEGFPNWTFDPETDVVFDYDEVLSGHANGMRFSAFDENDNLLVSEVYYSIGGGFVQTELELARSAAGAPATTSENAVPFPFSTAHEMLTMAEQSGLTIADMKRENELAAGHGANRLSSGVGQIWQTMDACVKRGLS